MPELTRNVPISTQIAELIRDRISDGIYVVGEKLPSEADFASTLEVSRNSVREALRSLVHSGLLRARAGDGTYVQSRSELGPALLRRARAAEWGDVLEVRALIERHASRMAALHATPEQIAGLHRVLVARDASSTAAEHVARDVEFHRLIVRSGGNPLLADIYESLAGISSYIASVIPTEGDFQAFLRASSGLTALHHRLLDAIETGDEGIAESAAVELLAEATTQPAAQNPAGEPA
jgi:DNA-binding FadR family transcriptional regulator